MLDPPLEIDIPPTPWTYQPEVLLVFLVVDVGVSMKCIGIPRLNQISSDLFQGIACDPVLDDKTRVSVIEFAQEFEVLVPASSPSNVHQIPGFVAAESPSSYGRMFRRLHGEMYAAVAAIERSGRRVLRPWVLLVSQGLPSVETWRDQHAALCGSANPARPLIIPLGFTGADWTSLSLISNSSSLYPMFVNQNWVYDLATTPIGRVVSEISSFLTFS